MSKIKLVCPHCGFLIEEYSAEQLQTDVRKQKRHKYLMSKQTLCPACLTQAARLKELHVDNDEPQWTDEARQALLDAPPETRDAVADFARAEGYPLITAVTVEKARERVEKER
jgi:hypothetical protein